MREHHWQGERPDPNEYYGFLYIITNNLTGKKYIGRKFYHMYSKRKRIKESNWRTYTGSCKPLNEDIKKHGKSNFTFEIFKQYRTRGCVVYYECNYQHKFDVLTAKDNEGERLWYNGNIGAIKFIPPDEDSNVEGTRAQAKRNGDRFYRSKKCKYGHDSKRYTINGQCVACERVKYWGSL